MAKVGEKVFVQTLIPEAVVEAFDKPVLHQGIAKQCPERGFAWRDVVTLDLPIFLPFQNGIRRQFGAPSRQICLANRLPGNGYR